MPREGMKPLTPGNMQNPTEHGPEQPTVADPAPGRRLDYLISRAFFQPQQYYGEIFSKILTSMSYEVCQGWK